MHEDLLTPERGLAVSADGLPHPQQLADLGTVLCLYRPQHGSELAGWMQASRVEVHAGLDSDGLRECLLFFDYAGHCCWRLWLLPDSDFLAWDRMTARLPDRRSASSSAGIGERLWQRLANKLTGDAWRGCALRLHAMWQGEAPAVLSASLATFSPLGLITARHIARAEGADLIHDWDECCCARAAARAVGQVSTKHEDLILRLNGKPS